MYKKMSAQVDVPFVCTACAFETHVKANYLEHLATQKHYRNNHPPDTSAASSKAYNCTTCSYTTSRKSNFTRHAAICSATPANKELICEYCRRPFKSTLWLTRHQLQCNARHAKREQTIVDRIDQMQNQLQQILDRQQSVAPQVPDLNSIVHTIVQVVRELGPTTVHNNSHNTTNTFNLHVFLNEKCKNAMNIMDFARNIQLELSDLEHIGKVGYVAGITDVISKGLRELDLYERPLHCTDSKRDTLHVKHENTWHKEEAGFPILLQAVKEVRFRNHIQVENWLEQHPEANLPDHHMSVMYERIVREVTGGFGSCNKLVYEANNQKIMKRLCKAVVLDKNMAALL